MLAGLKTVWKLILASFLVTTASPVVTLAQSSALSHSQDIIFKPITGNIKILFVMVKYPGDNSSIMSSPEAQEHAEIVKDALEVNSYGRAVFSVEITPDLIMPQPDSFYQNRVQVILRDAVEVARLAGFPKQAYDRLVVFTKRLWGFSRGFGFFNKFSVMSCDCPFVTLHEIGHTFDWTHANFWEVESGSPISPNGQEINYGDKFDMMGGSAGPPPHAGEGFHHFQPWFKYRVGWLPEANILTITESGTYTIQAFEADPQQSSAVTRFTALRVPKDPHVTYWVYFRSEEPLINYGAVITHVFDNNIFAPRLLDMSPGSQSEDWRDAALRVGEVFTDPQPGIQIRVLRAASDSVQVEINIDPNANLASLDQLPVVDVLRPLDGQTVEQEFDYEVTTYDPDSGTKNGDGISKVALYLHGNDDVIRGVLLRGNPPPTPEASVELSSPPYVLHVDTRRSSPAPIANGNYLLVAIVTSTGGGVRTVWQHHRIDNTGSSLAVPAVPQLATPGNNSNGVPTNPALAWKTANRATSYHLQVATESNFSTQLIDESGISTTSFQASGLSSSTGHYWRVNAINGNGTSDWSNVWQFTTAPAAPLAPTLESPPDGSTGAAINPALLWNATAGAETYRLQVARVLDFSSTDFDQSEITADSMRVAGLEYSTQYFWRVQAINENGTSDWSTVWRFTTRIATSVEQIGGVPNSFRLAQNYPNPFNPSTSIAFDLPERSFVTLKIFTVIGQQVTTLISRTLQPGEYVARFEAGHLSSGVFLYQLKAGNFLRTRKMLLIR